MLGAVAEYHRRVTAERTQDAKRRAVARGVPPFPNVPPGYRLGDGRRLEPDPDTAPVGRRGVPAPRRRRDRDGRSRAPPRARRRAELPRRRSRCSPRAIYLGELRFGDLVNTASHTAIVDADTWAAVQKARSPRGRRAKSERLLARLGVLRCATCGARMVVGTANHSQLLPLPMPARRRLPAARHDQRRARRAHGRSRPCKDLLAGVQGSASLAEGVADAERDLEHAERELDAAVQAFTGLEDVQTARERLARATRAARPGP